MCYTLASVEPMSCVGKFGAKCGRGQSGRGNATTRTECTDCDHGMDRMQDEVTIVTMEGNELKNKKDALENMQLA